MSPKDRSICPFGPEYQVYWDMRHMLFSKFDEARVDATGLYTMVPEGAARFIAGKARGSTVLDVCSGIGAMSIAFARAGKRVTSVEIDRKRVEMARHNARLYGVDHLIEFLAADIAVPATLQRLPAEFDTVFLDPPWGTGPGEYQRHRVIFLEKLHLAGLDLRDLVAPIPCREVMLRLPPNFHVKSIEKLPGEKVGFTTRTGLVHWYFLRTEKEAFVNLPRSAG